MAFCSVHPAGISNSRARPATCSSFTPRFSPASTPARQCKPGERNPPKCIAGLVNTTSKFAVDPKLIATAFSATSKLFVTTLIGVIAAAKGLLDKTTLQVLAKIVYYIFLPALMLTNVVATLSAGGASELFWLPLAALFQIAIGGIAGMLGARLLRLNPTESRVYLVCCAWGNSAALPLLFASALFADSAVRLAGMVSGISFFLLGWSGVFWGLGFHLLATLPEGNPGGAVAEKRETESFDQRMRMVLKRVFSPPLIASLIGLGIGFILPSVRATLAGSPIAGAVRSVASSSFAALRTLGAGYSPVAVLVLAGSLARRIEPPTEAASELSAAGSMRIRRMGVGIALVRFLLMPLVGVAMVTFGGGIFTSPFAKFTILLQSIMPPAQNSTLILNMEGKGDAATQVARVLVGIYVLGIAVIPVGLSVFLSIAGL